MSDDRALDKLKKKIQEAKDEAKLTSFKENKSQNLAGQFFNVGVELFASVLIGAGLGVFIDWVFGISPWGLICFFILGSLAGMLNVYRVLTSKKSMDKKKDTDV
ncbi:MAG TPA: AtpZ/AtpI family protein [Alphaproteobacteria bacterium]|nr:AtpZ/AtpI family protein [Alphaproteobacteria bacterium]